MIIIIVDYILFTPETTEKFRRELLVPENSVFFIWTFEFDVKQKPPEGHQLGCGKGFLFFACNY